MQVHGEEHHVEVYLVPASIGLHGAQEERRFSIYQDVYERVHEEGQHVEE